MFNHQRPEGNGKNGDSGEAVSSQGQVSPPTISFPKGGGAIRGIGEKFAANPVTGTASMTVPIATSPGRSGFGPQLSLSYDSGAGNGPFGFGWSLSLPAITRKTDKGLPQYLDGNQNQPDSDVFILSGAEDLVPLLQPDGSRFEDNTSAPGYTIHRYRPRIGGLFARIERWTSTSGDVHWRSISRDNILTLYGKDANSRIFDPEDPKRIFSWLICETRDDKGNAIIYEYKPEDGAEVDLTQAHERNRGDLDDLRRTTNRYPKCIYYGNRTPLLDNAGHRPPFLTDLPAPQREAAGWMFEVVFDYGEHNGNTPKPDDPGVWPPRNDPFSTYRAGFEVRTYRLCQRVLMFHHIPDLPTGEKGYDGLVRSTDFTYSYEQNPTDARNPIYSFLLSVTQSGYQRQNNGYLKANLPPIEFDYSWPVVQDTVQAVDAESLENLPIGLDGATYQWTDLHGEGIPGILTEQAGAWFYKRNLSPISNRSVEFAPLERVAIKPNIALANGAQFMDLAGDGQPDLVVFEGLLPGLYEHDSDEGWLPFRPFTSRLNHDIRDPNLKFVDLDGDGHADVIITEDNAFVWHAALAEEGFGPARRVAQALDEEDGPRLVFNDGAQSIYLADLSGDGLTDLVRIRNGEVCYWPNLGYGRFGAKVTMDFPVHTDQRPCFDHPDQFDHKRIRLADIDGSGTTDIIYLHRDGVCLYFNQSGNSWSKPHILNIFPQADNLVNIVPTDLLGNGTACLVWSSPLPGDARRQMRYVDLMGGQKPHLLIKTINNLGAETRVQYASSAKFYLRDKRDDQPWITRLPFPVHVVERVETYDHISRNRFVTRYAYHHGYFDGEEREFRGFGMVEQWDTEEFAALYADGQALIGTNIEASSHVPPVLTRTWFHTGIYDETDKVSQHFSAEYYGAPEKSDPNYDAAFDVFFHTLLPDTILPLDLTLEEEREACRALKGSMLRQEVYALDGTDKEKHPYTVTEQNFTLRMLQLRGGNRHAVFFTHAREAISYHYEREPADPRIGHALTLEVDKYGNVLKSAAIGYGRRRPDVNLSPADQARQTQTFVTYTESRVTRDHDTGNEAIDQDNDYRTPLSCESCTYELTGLTLPAGRDRFTFDEVLDAGTTAMMLDYEENPTTGQLEKRVIEHIRTYYRRNDLAGSLPLGKLQSLALPFESYKLAFTPGLVAEVYGSRTTSAMLEDEGRYVHTEGDANWWISSGRIFYSPDPADTAVQELTNARQHFFLPFRYRNPFHTNAVSAESFVNYDAYDLLMVETRDALDNRLTVGERLPTGNLDPIKPGNNYRVLQPWRVMDPNRNRIQVAFDTLGMVVGTAIMGKPEENLGDSLDNFTTELTEAEILDHLTNPLTDPPAILSRAATRLVYDLFAYQRSKDQPDPQPAVVYTLARETHDADLETGQQTKVQHSFSYSDGFGREIQKKIQAEPEKINGVAGPPRWVGSGWTIFNNKGKPIRQYEPFFSATHRFEFGVQVGISPILFYDPVERVVATLHPNHTYEKVVFDPWQQTTFDVNDTVTLTPSADDDVKGFFLNPDGTPRIAASEYRPTWYELRTDPLHTIEFAARYPDAADRSNEMGAAAKAVGHADTPTTAHFDSLGRPFLTITHNKVVCPNHDLDGTEDKFHTRVELDIEGNQRAVRDAIEQNGDPLGRIVMRYNYDMLGNRIHQASMEAGQRWTLNDVAGKPIRAWDSRGHIFRTEYDPLRRPVRIFVTGADPAQPNQELLTERLVYGEQYPEAELRNLRGKLYLHLDQAGAATNEAHDFKGNLLRASRRLAMQYKQAMHWGVVEAILPINAGVKLNPTVLNIVLAAQLAADTYTAYTTYDALNRPITLRTPDNSVIRPSYNEANLLERVDANLRGATANGQPLWTPFVTNIDYDAKGQRTRIDYGNGVSTFYEYDPLTFRLIRLLTRRNSIAFPDDCTQPPPAGWPGCQVQNLHYTYDPAGNITHIRDNAQQTIFFRNQRVEPSAEYTYDALYRLIEATGREHLGQVGGAPIPHSHDDASRMDLLHPGDGNAMGNYIERYIYDAVGNFLKMQHRGSDPAHAGWTRSYAYTETSLIEDGTGGALPKTSNRLSSTTIGNGNPITERYIYDAHGNMTRMPHLGGTQPAPNMRWDYRDQLSQADLGGGGTAYYVYDAAGQRIRKVIHRQNDTRREERIYLGGYEIYREFNGNGQTITLERETLHITDDKRRLALVETKTIENQLPITNYQSLPRYQFSNHLGSASLELDHQAQIISYEEYTPYGSSTYQAVRSQTETPKRYRYTGKERDEESGLYYHGARYLASWLARWISTDPSGLRDGNNLFAYVSGNPTRSVDPTGTQGKEVSEVADEAVQKLDQLEQPFEQQGKVGLRSQALTMDIDEPNPVGQKGLSPAEARARATDPTNRQLLDPLTNRQTKHLGVDSRAAPSKPPISVAQNPEALLNRRFSEITEMQEIFDEALAKIKDPGKLSPTELKNRINSNVWDIIKNGKGESATKVRAALGKLGFENMPGRGYAMKAVEVPAQAEAAAKVKAGGRPFQFVKWGGRVLLVVGIAADAVEVYYAENKAKTITKKAGFWAGAWAGGKAGAWGGARLGAGIALLAGQAGPQVAAPEEVVTVPAGGLIGGIIGGIGGAVVGGWAGGEVTETVYEWTFEKR